MSQSDFVSRGQALVAAGQFQEAVKVCRLGLLGRPTTVEGRVVLGQALLALKRFDEVLAEMRVALELDHTSVPAQVLRAEALLRKGDTAPAIEALHKALQAAPGDLRILQLLGEAENGAARVAVSHPAVSFIGSGDTKNYPAHTSGSPGDEESGPGHYTKPTALQSPGSARRSSQRQAAASEPTDITPPPAILAVGDRSGTVEVDPELEGVEVPSDPDFDGPLAAPPPATGGARGAAQVGGGRGSVQSASRPGDPATAVGKVSSGTPSGKASGGKSVTPAMALGDDDVEEIETVALTEPSAQARPPGPGTAVRNAVAMPSGVIGDMASSPGERKKGKTLPPPRPQPPSVPPPLAQKLAAMPHQVQPAAPRPPIAAALPTVAAAQPPPPFAQQAPSYPPSPASLAAAQRPTVAIASQPGAPPSPALQASAAAVDRLFGNEGPAPGWGQNPGAVDPRSLAAAQEPTARPGELDPQVLAMMSGSPQPQAQPMPHEPIQLPPNMLGMEQVSAAPQPAMKTGVRKSRSRLQVFVWILVGIVVIGGGVFAGFQIRAMRLGKQIAAARQHATDLARADTWSGWTAARDSLAGIAQASSTLENRAALARVRALVAYEFGDGVAEARAAVEELAGQGGLDGNIAATFDALLRGDASAARTASDAAAAGSEADAAAQYAAGQAALLAGNAKLAVAAMKIAADKDARPLYGIGLAHAYAAAYDWEEAIAALDRVLAGHPDHPAAVIARGNILSAAGRILPGSALGNEVKAQLERVIGEGRKPAGEQAVGVSPAQLAHAFLALARVELARGDLGAARKAVRGAADVNLDDARFAEDALDALYTIGELALARTAGDVALAQYASSARLRITYAQILLAQGSANEAIDVLVKQPEVMALPDALAVRGMAHVANGDSASAAADFEAALEALPTHEMALVGQTWLDIADRKVTAETVKRIAERVTPKGASLAVATAYAAVLRRGTDPAERERAKEMLEKVVAGPGGPEVARAQLELARIYRDAGDFNAARVAYDKASRSGSSEARLESALVLVEYSKPEQGREILEKLLEEAGDRPSPQVVLETARVRTLVGAHADAEQLLALADKMSSVQRWKLDRERGRLALRKSDFTAAVAALGRALDGNSVDTDTLLLAADAAIAGSATALADKVKKLASAKVADRPVAQIVNGKLLVFAEKLDEAEAAYKAAKQVLRTEKASNRRLAQADFGLAVIDYLRQNYAAAQTLLELVIQEDPTLVDAYIVAAEIVKDRKKAYEYAQKAARYNPDYAYAWLVVGKLAHEQRDKRTLADAIARLTQIAPKGNELAELQKLRGR